MPATKAAATGLKPSQHILSKKVDKLTDALSEFQTLTRKGLKTISQQIDTKFEAAFGELKVQVDQHSSELKCLKADFTQELQSFHARLTKMEEASAAGVPMDTDSSGSSSGGNNISDIIKRAREMSLKEEKAREMIVCFPPHSNSWHKGANPQADPQQATGGGLMDRQQGPAVHPAAMGHQARSPLCFPEAPLRRPAEEEYPRQPVPDAGRAPARARRGIQGGPAVQGPPSHVGKLQRQDRHSL
jgi:hypothetical protein